MNYAFRRGRVIVITWAHGGEICKVLARPGQIVYDTIKNDIYILKNDEYILYNALWVKSAEYLVARLNDVPAPGFKVHAQHLRSATSYEKYLRLHGEHISPLENSEEPDCTPGEIIVLKSISNSNVKPKMVRVLNSFVFNNTIIDITLSNGEIHSASFIKRFYRKPVNYEELIFRKKNKKIKYLNPFKTLTHHT